MSLRTLGRRALFVSLLLCTLLTASGCGTHRRPAAPARPAPNRLAALQREIGAILDAPAFSHGRWSALITSLKSGETLYERDAQRLMMPASNMKVLTASAAAERLGWDFRFETRLMALGPIHDGVLHGDLLIIGDGDPTLDGRSGPPEATFREWGSKLRAAGITRIDGRLVGDDDILEEPGWGFGWSWDDLADGYGAPIGALQLTENSVGLTLEPGLAPGLPAIARISSTASALRLDNRLLTGDASAAPAYAYRRRPGDSLLILTGTIPMSAGAVHEAVAVDNPTLYFARTFERGLAEAGIVVTGGAADVDDLPSVPDPKRGTLLLSHQSAPLSEVIRTCLKVSSNLYAETLLKTLGRVVAGQGTSAAGLQVVRETLTKWGAPVEPLIMRDGSGLSRYNYVTADLLVGVHAHMAGDARHAERWMAALPVGGRDGTLASRLKTIDGRVHAKTGSISNVRALSGYVTAADGEPLAFAIIGNHFEVPPGEITGAIDRVVETVAAFTRK